MGTIKSKSNGMKETLRDKEYLIYEGQEYTIEWYHNSNGNSQAKKYFDNLDRASKLDAFILFKIMGDVGKILNIQKFRHEGDQIYAFKPKPHRFLCFFFSGRKIIVTNGFVKKQDKLVPHEKKKAQDCKSDYESRVKKGIYYE